MVPQYGFRFNPTDQELIQILHCKASNFQQMSSLNFITHINIYDHEPQLLPWNETPTVVKDERYYYYKKENESREVVGRGWWKATSHVKKVYNVNENDEHVVVGLKRPLTFHKYRDNHGTNRSNAIKTNWIMHEYTLHSNPTEWRLCKLKYKGKPSLQEEMENIRQSQYSSRDDSEAVNSNSNSNSEQNSLLDDNNINNDDEWVQLLQPSYTDDPYINIDTTNQYLLEDPIEQQFPGLWSW